ncbi:MAG TPA: hypothetical protein VND83_10255 [Acidimicrobiales bacterium]|nr:hypothetical protein [Acidimicrobiales bacterium]
MSDRVSSSRDKLAGIFYDMSAEDLVRFRPHATDDAVAGIVRTVTAEGQQACEEFRRQLGDADLQTLRQFAVRRAVLARRQTSLSPIYESLDAFALLPRVKDVPWDSWVKADLFLARSQGGDPDLIDRRFQDVASEDAVARWHVALEAMNRVEVLSQCRVAEVTTTYGAGMLELINYADSPGGFSRAPALGFTAPYDPTTNLAQLAVTLADSLDATGDVQTGPITQDQLAATSFSLHTSGSYLETLGCLSFVAQSVSSGPSYTVYVAEFSEDADVDLDVLVHAASATNGQSALGQAYRLVLLSPQPIFDEELDDGEVDSDGDDDDDRGEDIESESDDGPEPEFDDAGRDESGDVIDFSRAEGLARSALVDPNTQQAVT